MVIRRKQLRRLADSGRQQYVTKLTDFLNERFPESANVPREELQAEVSRQVERAAEHGLETEQQAATYTVTAWLAGRDFDVRYAGAAAILHSGLRAEVKADKLAAWTADLFEALEK